MDKSKLILPVSILVASVIFGSFLYIIQVNKQKSIEWQQSNKTLEDKINAKAEKADKNFTNNLKCQTLLKDLKQRWNNVVGISYSEIFNTCMVKYTKNGITETAAVENMQDSN